MWLGPCGTVRTACCLTFPTTCLSFPLPGPTKPLLLRVRPPVEELSCELWASEQKSQVGVPTLT